MVHIVLRCYNFFFSCYSECSYTPGKQTRDLWYASPTLYQLSYEAKSVRATDISELCQSSSFDICICLNICTLVVAVHIVHRQWRRQASEFGGGGAFKGQSHILGGQDRIFKKVLLFAHAVIKYV